LTASAVPSVPVFAPGVTAQTRYSLCDPARAHRLGHSMRKPSPGSCSSLVLSRHAGSATRERIPGRNKAFDRPRWCDGLPAQWVVTAAVPRGTRFEKRAWQVAERSRRGSLLWGFDSRGPSTLLQTLQASPSPQGSRWCIVVADSERRRSAVAQFCTVTAASENSTPVPPAHPDDSLLVHLTPANRGVIAYQTSSQPPPSRRVMLTRNVRVQIRTLIAVEKRVTDGEC
jgi:hypothetical protein